MWQPEKYPRSLIEALAMHSLLFTLGYSVSDEMLMLFSPKDVFVVLKAEGREATFRVGTPEFSPEVMREKMLAIMKEWNTGGSATQADKDALYASSKTRHLSGLIRLKLLQQGFRRTPRENDPLGSRN